MTSIDPLRSSLESISGNFLPRILTQVCRDPGHPAYGCFDRNWWHYKIRDFPSIILQQGGYALWKAAEARVGDLPQGSLRELAAASVRFWNRRALRHGAFEEYYPWEEGYPPLAFGTLAAAKLVAEGLLSVAEVESGLRIASRQLADRFEPQAANQQVAGLAAMAQLHKLDSDLVSRTALEKKLEATLALQNPEGWYEEYGGPDIGYLSVTMDCLFDLHDVYPDEQVKASILSAARFISDLTASGSFAVGLHNARNTDYLVPYGLIRTAMEMQQDWPEGGETVERLFSATKGFFHPLPATDDRYLCHYIGHSVFRALGLLQNSDCSFLARSSASMPSPSAASQSAGDFHFWPNTGHVLAPAKPDRPSGVLVSCQKGGVVTLQSGEIYGGDFAADFGWQIREGETQHITHWWCDHWKWKVEENQITVEGPFVIHRETESSPWKHFALRGISLLFGRKIITQLKAKLIFRRKVSPYRLHRQITIQDTTVTITDQIFGLDDASQLCRAPRPSKRHVASADSFHIQDLILEQGFEREEVRTVKKGFIEVRTAFLKK